MQEHQTADPERRFHLLRKASTSVHVSSKLREGALLAQFATLRKRFLGSYCEIFLRGSPNRAGWPFSGLFCPFSKGVECSLMLDADATRISFVVCYPLS